MKMIAAPAMAAIDAGEAIVSGAVEIYPVARATLVYSDLATVDINAVTNASTTIAGGASAGVSLSGLDPSDVLRFTLPGGGTYTAWNWGTAWQNEFDLILDGDTSRALRVSNAGVTVSTVHHGAGYSTAAAAQAAFGTQTISGASEYTFFFWDDPTADNSGGLSIKVERGVWSGGVAPPSPLRLSGGYGPITLDGEVYQPLGDYAFAQQSAGAIGGVAQGLTLGVSGIEPAALELLDADEVKAASVVIRRLIFASDGKTLLDHAVWDRGRGDTVATDEVIGGAAAIALAIESAARGLGHSGARMRADSDQRLISATDGYFKNTAFAGQKELYWGGKKPVRTGSAVGGTVAVAGSAGGTGAGF